MITKYDFEISEKDFLININRLTNQLWKLIPMRENEEDWKTQIDTVLIEVLGLHEIFNQDKQFLVLLTKLEGLKKADIEFTVYRKTVFETISLLRGLRL